MAITSAMLLAGFAAMPAAAQMVSAATPDSLVKVLQAKGYKAELTADEGGDPLIKSASGGASFAILFFGCKANKACETVQFYAGFNPEATFPLERVNEWNATKRFARAYVDKEGDPVIEMDVDLDDGGMSTALFEDNLEFWVALMDNFRTFAFEKK